MKGRIIAIAATAAVAGGIGLGVAGSASATSGYYLGGNSCANGVFSGYCGSQVDGNGNAITAGSYGGQLSVKPYVSGNPRQEFTWLAYQGDNSEKEALYTPGGTAAEPNQLMCQARGGDVALVPAPSAIPGRCLWNFNGTGWTNDGTGDQLTSFHGHLFAVKNATGPQSKFTFQTP